MSSEIVDVFQSEQPVVVDGDLIEASKENIQPLASGRKATALSAVLSTPHAQRESKLAATRNRLRVNVEVALEDDDDNPLEAYCQLVYWTLENYPQGHSAESGLLELLEEATRVLKDHNDGIWRNDPRYLKLWVLYANYVEKPTLIYRYLLANEIGTTFALLYEEFAAALERNGSRVKADETYLLGINRRATPVERLQAKYRDFQKRMMVGTPQETGSLPEEPQPPTSSTTQRKVLGESTRTSRSSRPTHSTSTTVSSRPPDDVFGPRSGPSSRPKPPNARMQIFVDPSGASADETLAAEDTVATPWNELGSRKERIKENVPKVSKLKGTTLSQPGRQQRVTSAPAVSMSSRIPVFRDPAPVRGKEREIPKTPGCSSIIPFKDEVKEAPSTPRFVPFKDEVPRTPSASSGAQVPESVMKVKTIGTRGQSSSSEAEALRKDPFKNYPDKPLETE
ncbi:Mad3/BUB1 homology region 1-domain-containing protein [Russula aff. rugulosa BPL654]|nr:Mad3/BUB1 homology region 1-domain-containing protein [Russula aff. rugulosa BPL654]